MSLPSRNIPRPNDHSNLHLLAIKQHYHSYHRRSSEGNYHTPTELILRLPSSLYTTMEESGDQSRNNRSNSLSPQGSLERRRSSSISRAIHEDYSHQSGCSSPSTNSEISIASCSELVEALEAIKQDLRLQGKLEFEDDEEELEEEETAASNDTNTGQSNEPMKDSNTAVSREKSVEGRKSPVKALSMDNKKKIAGDVAEKEKILNECKNQIKTLTTANKTLEKRLQELETSLALARAHKVPCRSNLKLWPRTRGCIQDLEKKLTFDDHYVEPSEIIAALLESERRYVTGLSVLNSHYQQPMRMLSSFKPDILSMEQLNALFLNCSELLIVHRTLYEDILCIPSLPESAQVDKLFEILEGSFPAFGHYNSHMASNRPQNIQREMRQLKSKPQFEQLLNHCQENCEGIALTTLLNLPTERMSEYSELLTHFLNPRVRALPEDASKRAEALIRFLRNIRYNPSGEKSEWDNAQEKIKLLNKIATDGPIPLEIFNSDVRFMKQGPLTQVVGKKEMAKHCILFNNYIALAQAHNTQYRIMENGMIPLYGAQLHKCVDVAGQAIGSDLQSGLSEDKLAFRLTLVNNDSLYLRAARPNELRQWVETLEKCIKESQELRLELEMDMSDHRPLCPIDAGPKIAAASLEKLFQQLTSPHFELHQDFMRVFLLTHSCFTTPKEVLTALLNCIKSPDDNADRISQASESDLFLFNMPLGEISGSGSGCVSASPSMYTINTDSSELGSPGPSPSAVRRSASSTHTSVISSSPSPNALQFRNGNSARKAVYSGASFVSTDSDVSPHSSAVVVDNGSSTTQDGWALEAGDPEFSIRKRLGKVDQAMSPATPPEEGEHYSKLYAPNRVCLESEASEGEEEEEEEDEEEEKDGTLRGNDSSKTLIGSPSQATRRKMHRSVSESGGGQIIVHSPPNEGEGTHKETLDSIRHSQRMQLELDEASQMMAELTESLDTDFCGRGEENEVFERVNDKEVKRRMRSLSGNAMNRLGIVSTGSLSTSEPDLSACGMEEEDTPPPLPPRHPDMYSVQTTRTNKKQMLTESLDPSKLSRMLRRGSEHNLLTTSMSSASSSVSGTPSHSSGKDKKSKTLERKQPKEKKKKKKSDTFSGRATPVNVLSSPAKSSQMYFGNSPSHTSGSSSLSASQSFNASGDMAKTPKKSRWLNVRRKIKKNFTRSPSFVDADEIKAVHKSNKPQRSHSIPAIKKSGVYNGRNASISGCSEDLGMNIPDGLISPRARRASTSPGNNVNLVSKVFSILMCWVEDYFEDFEANDLTQFLTDTLETLICRTTNDTLEYHMSHQLIEVLNRKKQHAFIPSPTCSFPKLLGRIIHIKPEVLEMYDWENPDRLMKGREIDLSKGLPKESLCLKIIAEQLTLMEFSVYAAIQRKELLNCNWKKPDKEKLSPNVCRLIRRTNDMTSWVSTEILQRKTPPQRATVIEHFVQIANHCYKHNDLHCALNITIALGSACIKSLRQTWNEVDKKWRHKFDKLKDSMDYHGRCKKMRENLDQLTQETFEKTGHIPAALPYIGAYLDIIYTLEISSKTYNQDGLVNFAKMTKLAEMVTSVLQYQDVGFNFEPRLDVMAYVTAAKRLSENDLYELSMTVEPPSN